MLKSICLSLKTKSLDSILEIENLKAYEHIECISLQETFKPESHNFLDPGLAKP